MKRSLLYCVVSTIVAAFQVQLAAAVPIDEDVPVAGGTAAIARALGIDPPPDRARFLSELTRAAYSLPDGKSPFVEGSGFGATAGQRGGHSAAITPGGAASSGASDVVPVPLTTAIWSDAVFHRRVAPADLVVTILADRQAALLCHGLSGLDDATLQFLAEHPGVITHLYERNAATFAAFAASLHIRDGRVVTPGGDAATALWEASVGEKVTRPDRFVRELFSRSDGRTAYLYDGIGQLDPPHAAFALGFWITSGSRADRFKVLTDLTHGAYHEWQLKIVPFARPIYDITSLLMRVRVGPDGTPSAPAARALWTRVFESAELPAPGAKQTKDGNDEAVDAGWLAQMIASGDVHQRGDRIDQFSFGQRVFTTAGDGDRADMLVALRAFTRYRMLMLTIERLGVTRPAVYSAAARHASRLALVDRQHGFAALAQFQCTLALVAHMVRVRTIDTTKAEALITSLSAVPVNEQGYGGNILEWIGRELRPLTPAADDVESGLIAQLSGVRGGATAPLRVIWEGQPYRLDLAAAEERRLHRIRERQNGLPLDVGLDLEGVARRLSSESATAADVTAAVDVLKKAVAAFPARLKGEPEVVPPGVDASRDPREILTKVIEELTRAEKSRDVKKAARIVEPLTSIAEAVAAEALLSLTYAVDLGDPDGTVLLAGNVARRHDFGFAFNDVDVRTRAAWSLPKQDVAPGAPWHVSGSALGLDVGLATLALRRVDTGRMNDAPKLTSNERQTFAASVALLNPVALLDSDRDAIADAIARGRARVAALTPESLDAVADEISMDGWRRRAMRWVMAHEPARTASMFSLTEMLYLGGGGSTPGLHAWGMAAVVSTGCLCTRLSAPGGWWNLAGRPQLGLLATAVADVHLLVALTLRDLGLPAGIARHVLSGAVQDYIDEVRPNDTDDWLTLVRAAQAIPRDRLEDYIAAVTADGPLVPDTVTGSARR